MFNSDNFKKQFDSLTTKRKILVAFSGGLDSQVLLHVLVLLRDQKNSKYKDLEIRAVHVNHSLSSNAKNWAAECQKVCDKYKVPLTIVKVDAKLPAKSGLSQEEVARKLRYKAFAKLLTKDEVLLTAHHQNDQAETLLLQLMRGAGVKGLAAMPNKMKFAASALMRPLLSFSREELEQYAKKHKLKWIDDESNLSAAFDRNFLRLNIMPLLKKRWPGVLKTLTRSANHLGEADFLLEELAARDLIRVRGKAPNTLSITKLLKLSEPAQRNLLRFWLQKLALPIPSSTKITQIEKTVLKSKSDAMPLVTWRGAEIRRFDDDLYALKPLVKHDPKLVLKWDLTKSLKLPAGLGTLSAKPLPAKKGVALMQDKVTVRFRCGGERIKLLGQNHSKTLKNLWQEWRVAPWQRDRIPLIYFNDELVAVVGFAVTKKAQKWFFILDSIAL